MTYKLKTIVGSYRVILPPLNTALQRVNPHTKFCRRIWGRPGGAAGTKKTAAFLKQTSEVCKTSDVSPAGANGAGQEATASGYVLLDL